MAAVLRRVLSVVLLLSVATNARAQGVMRRVEIGATGAIDTVTFGPARSPGVGASVAVTLSRSLALEARVTRLGELAGGHSTNVFGGVRATLIRAGRLGVFGKALPGVSHFDRNPRLGTHFVLDLTAGLAVAATSRLIVTIEGDRDLHAPRRGTTVAVIDPSTGAVTQTAIPAHIASRWNLHVGAAYRLGAVPTNDGARLPTTRWIIGPQVGLTASTGGTWNGTAGMFATYRLTRWCDFDTSVAGFVGGSLLPDTYEGGRLLQVVGGVKMGVRDGRFGVFFKARAGVNRDSRVPYDYLDPASLARPVTMPVLDLGGVVEAALTRRSVLRVDLGESLAFARYGTPNVFRAAIYTLPVRIGVGWRF